MVHQLNRVLDELINSLNEQRLPKARSTVQLLIGSIHMWAYSNSLVLTYSLWSAPQKNLSSKQNLKHMIGTHIHTWMKLTVKIHL